MTILVIVVATGALMGHLRQPVDALQAWGLVGLATPLILGLLAFARMILFKQADASLRLAASVFSHSQNGILLTDAGNCIIDVNPAFTRITGYPREEVLGQNPRLMRSNRQDPAFYAGMWEALRIRGTWQGEIWNLRKSGEPYASQLSISAVTDEDGQLQHYVGIFSDVTETKVHVAEMERIAFFDPLTGVPNRRLLLDRLSQALAHTQRSERLLAVCYLDLDGFKPVNDQFGHDAGDQLLVEIAARLQSMLRAGDTLARLGGDEFVLLLGGLESNDDCYNALERVLEAIARPMTISGQPVSVSASIGVTLCPCDAADTGTLLRHADQAMYQAKELGRNRFYLYDATHEQESRSRREGLKRLTEALEQREFVLHYQPKVHLLTGRVTGAEALIRWQHPERGILAPAEFLLLLAGSDLEFLIGEWVIETALIQIEAWQAAGLDFGISVNVGARHLQRPGFVFCLEQLLGRHPQALAGRLELEILESAALDDLDQAAQVLTDCKALGVHFALDDFGTGYSSLSYFRQLPVETLKIDQSFVRNMLADAGDLGIVQSVIHLAQTFGRAVIAEGVEDLAYGEMLVNLGCLYGQGYAIARPMPADEMPAWLARWQFEKAWCQPGRLVPASKH